ncbi:MAG: HlyD family secretion protein [Thermoguttaceae bacterium]
MSVQNPIELFESESPSRGDALVHRQHGASLRLLQVYLARQHPGASLAWAVFGILAGVVVALAGVVVALVYLLLNRPAPEAVPASAAPSVATASTEAQRLESPTPPCDNNLDTKGYILPVQRILVSPKVSGMIVKLHIREGCQVKKGDVLAELEDVDYKVDFLRAQSAVETARQQIAEAQSSQPKEIGQAEAEMERAKLELAQLKSDFQRSHELYCKHAAMSQMEYEASGTKFREAEQHVRSMDYALALMRISLTQKLTAAHTRLEAAEADLVKARRRLENCMVRAPSDGTILKKNAEEGNLVNPEAFSVCELANLSELEVELAIQERDICKLKTGQRCKIRTEAFPDRIYDGVVSRLMPVANRLQSTIPIRVKITVPQGEEGIYLKPEMIATVSFQDEASVARLDEGEKASSHAILHKQGLPARTVTSHRPLPASG